MDVRKLAIEAIEKIVEKKGFTHIVVNEYLRKFILSDQDKSFFTKLVYGTVENLLTIEYYLEPFLKKRQKPWVKYLLYVSIYQLVYLKTPNYAVVDEAVSIANLKDRSIGGFVNAVLRNFLRNDLRDFSGLDEIETLSIKYSYPKWLIAYLLKDYSYEVVEKILIEFAKVKKTAVRVNTLLTTNEEVMERLTQDGITFEKSDLVKNGLLIDGNILDHELFKTGKIVIQDLAAQLVSEVVGPSEGAKVLDACAAPGGKSSHLSAIMNNTGTIIACDIHKHKQKLMDNLFKNNGNKNIITKIIDARLLKNEEEYINSFNYILADVPCSGLGVMGHKVDLKYQMNLESIEEIKILQSEILNSTWELLKPGGYYTYSTCTLNKEENEQQIQKFLKNRSDVEVVYERTILPFEHNSDGFYICKMRKI
jgi:16S rRNA (cytosine967-C5)-methyltransferase